MKLYELPERYASLMDQIADGELTPDLEKELDLLDATLQGKVDGICKMVRQLEGEAEVLDREAARLKLRAGSRDNAAKRLKVYLQTTMEKIGCQKVTTDLFTASLARSPKPTVTCILTVIPEQFRRVITELDKTAVLEAWKRGEALPEGFTVDDTKKHLRIT
jgi:hypothetical protein